MSRVTAALVVLLLAASPVAGVAAGAGGHGGNPCCHGADAHCGELTLRASCCDASPSGTSTQPPPVASPSSGRDVLVAEVAAPAAPEPLVAIIASRTYTSRQGLDIHAPPHLQLCVFLI